MGRVCRCGRLIDPNGHHHAACARTGVLCRRGSALESAAARTCREAGGRVRTTVVSALHGDGRPRRGAADRDGVALMAARKRKEQSYPELLGARCRARLVVLAVEVGGRFSRETSGFITELAKARARSETTLMRKRAEQAWRMRWCGLFGLLQGRSLLLCWSCKVLWGWTVTRLHRLRWKGTSTMQALPRR